MVVSPPSHANRRTLVIVGLVLAMMQPVEVRLLSPTPPYHPSKREVHGTSRAASPSVPRRGRLVAHGPRFLRRQEAHSGCADDRQGDRCQSYYQEAAMRTGAVDHSASDSRRTG